MKKILGYVAAAWGLSPVGRWGLSPLICLMAALVGCVGQSPEADGWGRLERDFATAQTEYRQRLDAANTTVEITEAASFGWSRFEDLLSRVTALRIASGESASVVEKEIAELKAKSRGDGEKESAQFEGGSMATYVGGLVANDEVAMALAEMLAARKGNVLK